MLPGWTKDELIHEVAVVPRRAFLALPDTQVIERPGWLQLITPSLRQGGLNEVSLSCLDEAVADAVIDATLADYARRGLRFRWTVGPGSAPADLADRLGRRGLRRTDLRGMVRATANPPAYDSDILIDEVDALNVASFTAVMAAGWGMDPGPIDAFNRLILADPLRRNRLFLARQRGEPAAVASLTLFQRSVYLIGAVVLPAFRGRGLYRALCSARLRLAAAQGVTVATCQAREATSAPILDRLGFQTVCRFPSFSNDSPS